MIPRRQLETYAILVAAWLVVLAYAYPGYMSFDSAEQLQQARSGKFADWHPPMMAGYWALIDFVIRGPFGMLMLQTALFEWGVYGVLRRRLGERAAAWATAGVVLFPPVLTPMTAVWKDAQMAGFLIAGLVLMLGASRRARIGGALVWMMACGVRDNAIAAVPVLAVVAVGAWGWRRRITAVAAIAGVTIGVWIAAIAINTALTVRPQHPWSRSVALMDMAGMVCRGDRMDPAEVERVLDGTGHVAGADLCPHYTTLVWFQMGDVFEPRPNAEQVAARRRAWLRLVWARPLEYLSHRWAVMERLLGVDGGDPWEPVCQGSALDWQRRRLHVDGDLYWWQRELGAALVRVADTPLYRPWLYAVLSLIFLGAAIARRDRLVIALCASGLIYEASYFVGAAAPDFRYSHWMIATTVIAAILTAVYQGRVSIQGTSSAFDRSGREQSL